MDNITLYNHFHNGDIFFSRIMINLISDKFNIEFFHNLKSPLFLDLPDIKESNDIPIFFPMHENPIFSSNSSESKIVNNWIGQYGNKYTRIINNGCSFENHFKLASEVCNKIGFNPTIDSKYLPKINSELIPNVSLIDKKIKNYKNIFSKIILICNGNVHSGQSVNFDFTKFIYEVSNKFPEFLFLITQPINLNLDNVVNTSTMTNSIPDLVQIGHISKYCDVIIGRASGPYCFSQNYDNLIDENKVFCCFCSIEEESSLWQDAKSKIFWSNDYSESNIIDNMVKSITFI